MMEQKTECTFARAFTGEVCPACGEALEEEITCIPGLLHEFRRRLPCECMRRERAGRKEKDIGRGMNLLRREARRMAGIPPRYADGTLSAIRPREGQRDAHAALTEFLAAWRTDRHAGGLLLVGAPGCGKTMLAAALAAELIDTYAFGEDEAVSCAAFGIPAHFRPPVQLTDVPSLMHDIRRAITAGDSADETADRLAAAPVLILDDLGAEYSSEYARSVLHRIIDHRWALRLPLIVTANAHTTEELAESIGTRGVDRLTALCRPVILSCASQRRLES